MMDNNSLTHTRWNCKYHIVFIPKYRRKVIYGNLKYKHGRRTFWARGYFVSTVGLNEATIAKYVREQEKEDMIENNMTKKEYEDPLLRVS